MRLAKFLAHAGVASRRKSELLIAAGRVSVGSQIVRDPATAVDATSHVAVDGRRVRLEPPEVHLLNKPEGVVSTATDTHGRLTVCDLVASSRRLYPVGRLDIDTVGLILLTNDGDLANRLTHPRYGLERTYHARVGAGALASAELEALRRGVRLDDGLTRPARVREIEPGLLELTLREGRKRQVRRMCAAVGHPVVSLERVAFGGLGLGALARGRSRRLNSSEIRRLWNNAFGETAGSKGRDNG